MANKTNYAELPASMTSKYLAEGFTRDLMRIYDLQIDTEEKEITAKMDLQDPYVSFYGDNPEFFLSVITAYRLVNQLINAYICEMTGQKKAELGKFFAMSNEMKTRRPIKTPRGIEAKVKCTKDIQRNGNRFMEFEFELQKGMFTGKIRGCGHKQNRD